MASHRDVLVDQFTRQAVPFSNAAPIRDEEALARIVDLSGCGPDDVVLDVACGPGVVVSAFAARARSAIGVDVTPAMLARAREVAAERGVRNVAWQVGDALRLPVRDAACSIVSARFALHHCPEPAAFVGEMARVCRPGGTVVVVDFVASEDPARAAAFHRVECLRDPSHVRALRLAELRALIRDAGLPDPRLDRYPLEVDVDAVLARSFPRRPEDAETVRRAFVDSLADDALGLGTRRVGDRIRFTYQVVILAART